MARRGRVLLIVFILAFRAAAGETLDDVTDESAEELFLRGSELFLAAKRDQERHRKRQSDSGIDDFELRARYLVQYESSIACYQRFITLRRRGTASAISVFGEEVIARSRMQLAYIASNQFLLAAAFGLEPGKRRQAASEHNDDTQYGVVYCGTCIEDSFSNFEVDLSRVRTPASPCELLLFPELRHRLDGENGWRSRFARNAAYARDQSIELMGEARILRDRGEWRPTSEWIQDRLELSRWGAAHDRCRNADSWQKSYHTAEEPDRERVFSAGVAAHHDAIRMFEQILSSSGGGGRDVAIVLVGRCYCGLSSLMKQRMKYEGAQPELERDEEFYTLMAIGAFRQYLLLASSTQPTSSNSVTFRESAKRYVPNVMRALGRRWRNRLHWSLPPLRLPFLQPF